MGYYTNYSLRLCGNDEDVKAVEQDILDTLYKPLAEDLVKFGYADEYKWYSSDEDMREIAKRHPNVLIILCGEGEDEMDIWEHRYKGEIDEYHQIEMPPFTNENLVIPA